MSLQWRRVVPASLRRLARRKSRADRIQELCATLLPPLTCVDVGASYYPHPQWELFRRSASTRWLAVDPNARNLGYLTRWSWPSKVAAVGDGLSERGGPQTLFITNVDSGSSLLRPTVTEGVRHRIDPAYFFPMVEKPVVTQTLATVLDRHESPGPVLVKLDTQGTEFSILRGLRDTTVRDALICVELECTLLACPLYEGAPKFGDVQRFMEANGFELVILKPIPGSLPRASEKLRRQDVLVECDAVFVLRPDIVAHRPLDHRLAMLGCYVAYELYGEALHLTRLLLAESPDVSCRHELGILDELLA